MHVRDSSVLSLEQLANKTRKSSVYFISRVTFKLVGTQLNPFTLKIGQWCGQ